MISINATKNQAGGAVNPKGSARGENGRSNPMTIMSAEVKINSVLDRLCTKGTFAVRITWMTKVCVQRDSRNQQV